MKRLFSIALVALLALFTACDSAEVNSDANFQLTSSNTKEVSADGGAVLFTYTIKNRVQGQLVEATVISGKDAVKNIELDTDGVIAVNVKANSSSEGRLIIVNASYGSESFEVVISQKSVYGGSVSGEYDVEFEGTYLNGYYYGEEYGEGVGLYLLHIGDAPMSNAGQLYSNAIYYRVYANAPITNSTMLPNGTYTFSQTDTLQTNIVVGAYSGLYYTGEDEDSTTFLTYSDAKMVVSTNKIVLELTIAGKRHKVTFNGSLECQDVDSLGSGSTGESSEHSTFTTDRHVTFDGEHNAKWVYEEGFYDTSYSNYSILIMNKANGYVFGDTLLLDLITDNTSKDGDFDGKYTISATPGKMVMVAGTAKGAQPIGSWLYEYGGASATGYANYAAIVSGTAELIKNSDGTHTVILDGYDYLGNNITCNWTGVINEG